MAAAREPAFGLWGLVSAGAASAKAKWPEFADVAAGGSPDQHRTRGRSLGGPWLDRHAARDGYAAHGLRFERWGERSTSGHFGCA